MKLLSTSWTKLPDGFKPLTVAVTDTQIVLGGEAGARFRADLERDELTFESLPFPTELADMLVQAYGYDDLATLEEENGTFTIDSKLAAFDFARVDWSTSPPQVAMNLTEDQGGSFGLWIENGMRSSFLKSPHDADIGFAQSYVLRGDTIIAESYTELSMFRRQPHGAWEEETIAFPTTHDNFEIDDVLLSQDGSTLAVVTSAADIGTAIFSYREDRFFHTRNLSLRAAMVTHFKDYAISYHYTEEPTIRLWDHPIWHAGATSHALSISPEEPPSFYPSISSVFGDDAYFGLITKTSCKVCSRQTREVVATIPLPEHVEKYAMQGGAIVGRWLVLFAQNQVGVIELDRQDNVTSPSKPRQVDPAPSTRQTGYARARQIFAQFHGHTEQNTHQILRLLEEIEPGGRARVGEWLWRGIREGLIAPSIHFAHALSHNPEWYDVNDVLAFMDAVDQEDVNAFASSYQMILNTIGDHAARYVLYWATTSGVLRADLGYELAKRRKLPVNLLPALSLQRATRDVATCHLCGPRDVSYSSRMSALRRLYHDPQIAAGMLDAVANAEYLGREMQQWFKFVWLHASDTQRVMLLLKTRVPENVLWLADRFAHTPLTTFTREELEATLSKLLVIELSPNMFLPSTRPYETLAFITAAILLGQDAARRRVGLSPVGGATFARALELGEMFPNMCGLTPEIEARLRAIYGA